MAVVFRRTKPVVGLDIGSSAVKAVELKPIGKGYRVTAYGSAPVPPDSIVDGAIIDSTAVADYQILDPGTGPDSRGSMEVLLVAAKKEKIGDYTSVIAQAGKTPVVVDVDAFALQNAYEANYGLDRAKVVVLLNAGASAININILQGEQSVFTRDISMGGNTYTEAVQKELDLPFESAEQLKKGVAVNGATVEDAHPVLHAITENVLLEIQKTFDFFKATASSDRIDRIILSGGASRVHGFRDMLCDRFGVPVEDFDPFRTVTWDSKKLSGDPTELASTAAVAVGLALRKVGDR
jgi:type IV pilus assembly protein PilM